MLGPVLYLVCLDPYQVRTFLDFRNTCSIHLPVKPLVEIQHCRFEAFTTRPNIRMKFSVVIAQLATVTAVAGAAIPKAIRADSDEAVVYPAQVDQSWVDASKRADSDEAVVYPAQVDQSWVDASKRSASIANAGQDSDEAVVYPAQVDQSWVDATKRADSDEAVVYPAQVDQSWVDASKRADSDEAVVYPAQVDQSWVDAQCIVDHDMCVNESCSIVQAKTYEWHLAPPTHMKKRRMMWWLPARLDDTPARPGWQCNAIEQGCPPTRLSCLLVHFIHQISSFTPTPPSPPRAPCFTKSYSPQSVLLQDIMSPLSSSEKYEPLRRISTEGFKDNNSEEESLPSTSWPQRRSEAMGFSLISWVVLTFVLVLSLVVNLVLVLRLQPLPSSEPKCGSYFAGLERTVPIKIHHSTEYTSDNLTAATKLWEELSGDPGVVALEKQFIDETGLPRALPFPWDGNKEVYLLQGFHNLHCLRTLFRYVRYTELGEPNHIALSHALHCLDQLRQDVICNADDTPRYAGFQDPPGTGSGQTRMCRDWSKLEKWALDRTACFKHEDEVPGPMVDRFKSCPDGRVLWPKGKSGE
ncbi:Phenylalanine aminomutase (L-beta-phenylalanine forming) [Paramyrothecium foliicola]|nr:Phenylalanine aminomutase (L-beta-phenylalanine forming) [Paramyrothecium foliicola]